MRRQIERITLGVLVLMALSTTALAQSNLTAKVNPLEPRSSSAVVESDRIRDGLIGPVRRVRTEIAKLSQESGRLVESKHAVLEIVAYDIRGAKVENQYFPIAGANLTGKEVYKYDDKGNISEMTLVNDDGSLVSKEVYKYEFDFAGNWNKMTTSVAVIEGGRMSFEPTEITYRSIMYYLDEKMMKMAQPVAPASSSPPASNPVAVSDSKMLPVNSNPTVKSSASNRKASPLPPSRGTADKLNLGSTELPNARTSAGVQSSMIQIDGEPPPAAPPPILKPISGGVLNGTAITLPSPIYPAAAKRLRISGVVSVEVVVDESGKVISASASSGPVSLRDVAVQAALRARFSPTKLSGQPVKVSGVINYKFSLIQ
jgi:TonB family protein